MIPVPCNCGHFHREVYRCSNPRCGCTIYRPGVITADLAWEIHIAPLDVYDARGVLLNRPIVWFNVTTGEVCYQERKEGVMVHDVMNRRMATITEHHPAPLMYITIPEGLSFQRRAQYEDY